MAHDNGLSGLSSENEDILLAERVRDNRDEDALKRLFEKHKGFIQHQCYKRLYTMEDAEDATQTTFADFWHRAVFNWQGGNVRGYLCGVAKYACSHLRIFNAREKRSGEMVYLDEVDADGHTYQLADPRAEYDALIDNEIELEIDRALLLLTNPKMRLAWILSRREGYEMAEIGKMCGGVHRCTVSGWVSKAEAFIREATRAFYEDLMNDTTKIEQRAEFRALFSDDDDE